MSKDYTVVDEVLQTPQEKVDKFTSSAESKISETGKRHHAKDFIIHAIENDLFQYRREIRKLKKTVSYIEDMRRAMRLKSDKDIQEIIDGDPELKKRFEETLEAALKRDKGIDIKVKEETGIFEGDVDEKGQAAIDKFMGKPLTEDMMKEAQEIIKEKV